MHERVRRFLAQVRRERRGGAALRSRPRGIRLTWTRPTVRGSLALLLLLAVAAVTAGGLLRLRIETGIESFLPAGDPAVAAIEDKARSFGGDPVAVLLESAQPQQLLADPQQLPLLLNLEGQLAHLPDVATVYGPATVLNQIAISAQQLLAQIAGKRDGVRAQAEEQARQDKLPAARVTAASEAAVADFDRRYGALLVRGLPAGLPTLYNPNFAREVVYDQNGQPRTQWNTVVPNPNTVAILVRPRQDLDQAGTQRLVGSIRAAVGAAHLTTSRTTVTGVPAITSSLTDEIGTEFPLLSALVAGAILLRFLLIPSRTSRSRRLWPLVASLIGTALTLATFGWLNQSMSFGAVAFLPLLLGIGSSFSLYLTTMADRRRTVVVSLASATGFASLAISPLPFVRELGIALAVGVVLTVVATLTLTRTSIGAPRDFLDLSGEIRPVAAPAPRGRRWALLGLLAVVAGFGWAVLPGLKIQANPEELAKGLPALGDAQRAEQVLGSSGEVNVILKGGNVLSPQALSWGRQAEDTVIAAHGGEMRPVLTMPDLLRFLGNSPTTSEVASGVQLIPPYLTGSVIRLDGQEALMIFGLKFQDLSSQTTLLADVRRILPPPPPGFQVDLVGLPVAADQGYAQVSGGRYLANLAGIAAAGAVLLIGLRRRSDALRAVLAALLATGWTLAAVWLFNDSLSPLTIALGSLTTVTGSEFTVLLADAYRRGRPAIRRVVALACVTSAIGYLALVTSRLWLLREFGIVLTATVLLSYLAAVSVVRLLPAAGGRRQQDDDATGIPELVKAEATA